MFYSSFFFTTFPLLLLSSYFSVNEREAHNSYSGEQWSCWQAEQSIALSKTRAWHTWERVAVKLQQSSQTSLMLLLFVPHPSTQNLTQRTEASSNTGGFGGDRDPGTRERGCMKICNSTAYWSGEDRTIWAIMVLLPNGNGLCGNANVCTIGPLSNILQPEELFILICLIS